MASCRPGSLCPGELSQLINILYQILGECQPALLKGSAASWLLRCFIATSSPCRAGGEACVSTARSLYGTWGERQTCSLVAGWSSPVLECIPNSQDNQPRAFYIPLANEAERELAYVKWAVWRLLNTTADVINKLSDGGASSLNPHCVRHCHFLCGSSINFMHSFILSVSCTLGYFQNYQRDWFSLFIYTEISIKFGLQQFCYSNVCWKLLFLYIIVAYILFLKMRLSFWMTIASFTGPQLYFSGPFIFDREFGEKRIHNSFPSHDLKDLWKKKWSLSPTVPQLVLLAGGSTLTRLCLGVNWGLDEGNWGLHKGSGGSSKAGVKPNPFSTCCLRLPCEEMRK